MNRARTIPSLPSRSTTPLLLGLVLLLAQSGAFAHRYSHVQPESGLAGSQQPCIECLSATPLLSAVAAPATAKVVRCLTTCTVFAPGLATLTDSARHFAFRSRAPPHLLR